MKFLITGGAGFIGSHLAEEITKLGDGSSIRIFDNMTSGKESNLKAIPGKYELIKGDIRDIAALRKAAEGIDAIFHHAALTSVPQSVGDPVSCNDVNINGTLNVLIAAKEAGVKRVMFASSSAVYGENPETPKKETLVPDPLSPYAASKLAGEIYCKIYGRLHGVETVCFRYFNVFGPRQDPNSQYAAVIPKFTDAIIAGRAPKVFGDGEQTRDFVFVKDVVKANLLAAKAPKVKSGAVFNVGTGISFSLNQLLDHFSKSMNKKIQATYTDPIPGDIKHSLADISLIKKELGFAPGATIENGLRETISWFEKNAKKL